jgi:hypothetical protein
MKIEYLIIKDENQSCNSLKTFKSFLNSNSEFRVAEKIINYKKFEVSYKLKTELINDPEKKERYFLLTIERQSLTKLINSKSNNLNKINIEINNLIDLKRALTKMLKESKFGFYVTILWDDTSYYFSRISYPFINEIENLMRKLIYKFMLIKIGKNWLSKALPKELENVIKRNSARDKEDDKIIQEGLFKVDFIDLNKFLFNIYYNSNIEEIYKKIENAKKITDLELKVIKELIPKSNWDKYFSKYFNIDKLEVKWEKLYELRNKVAHNKSIDRGNYEEIVKLTGEIKIALNKAIDKLDEIVIKEEEKKEISIANYITNLIKFTNDFSDKTNNVKYFYEQLSAKMTQYTEFGKIISNYVDAYVNNLRLLNNKNNENIKGEDKSK